MVVLLMAPAVLVVQAGPALACSCRAGVPLEEALSDSDGAFVGVLTGRDDFFVHGDLVSSGRPVFNHFQVERSIKGDIGEQVQVEAAASGASCGLELEIGERTGLLLRHGRDGWRSSLCSQTDPNALLAFAPDQPDRAGSTTDGSGGSGMTLPVVTAVVVLLVTALLLALRRAGGRRS